MNRRLICSTAFVLALTAYGCGGKPAANQEAAAPPAEPAATAASDSVSIYDAGPRAGESPVDEALARQGEQLFQQKGCTACHGFGKQVRGPDLNGVTMRRTAKWMEEQMLHPEIMTKQDPIARALFAQYSLQMTNLGLTEAQARSLVEFLKRNDRKIGAAPKP